MSDKIYGIIKTLIFSVSIIIAAVIISSAIDNASTDIAHSIVNATYNLK